ncbi:MAG: glycosyltransferase family 4 protein [Candidatus Omnitrophica bacterium]|nr:glycosyltransferase family 4 protein [Candidatus Omnitrophota bacterium]
MPKIKVLNIQPFDIIGSIQRRSLLVASELKKFGIENVFLAPTGVEGNLFTTKVMRKGFKVYKTSALRPRLITNIQSVIHIVKCLLNFPKCFVEIYKIIQVEQPDIIQINGFICIQEALAAFITNKKKFVWVLISDLYPRMIIFALSPLIRSATRVFVSRRLINYYLGKKGDKVIYEPVDINKFNPGNITLDEKNKMSLGNFSVVSTGYISPRKGYDYLIKSIKILKGYFPDIKLIIVGKVLPLQKEYYNSLRHLVKTLNLDQNVVFTGYVKEKELLLILSLADIFAMASTHEGTPVSILEAMAMEKPIVATNVGGISELVREGKTGILVSPRNAEELAKAIMRLLKDDKLRRKMGKNGRLFVKDKFSIQNCVSGYKSLYYHIRNRCFKFR